MERKERETNIYIAYEDHVPYDYAEPEKNLLRAILTGAMNDLKKGGEERRHAIEYLLSEDEEYIFSFNSVCSYLNIDPDRVLLATGLIDRSALRTQRAVSHRKAAIAPANKQQP